ncbi:MAG: GTP-binding protein [Candidatus Heimdallarchaeota archaeon]|nr:GTP-binding protein [Candidatus Heimdallarchaeota archaeon]
MSRMNTITQLMRERDKIRNIALVAHIDHGKTTLSDSLLSAAGILAPSTAGQARALDYLPEEQRRGITMKTANISLILLKNGENYLLNLIDSPGHVDFSGKVARALRIADGAIVIVDAVEQIMAQTETVIRQCIFEAVKPVLFINKIDRLIRELKFSSKQVAERIEVIYNSFNNLIEKFSKQSKVPQWSCTPKDGSVIFGSALHRWGLSVPLAKRKNITFEKILHYYSNNDLESLQERLPIEEPVIELIINHLPSPLQAQHYRIENIWSGDITSKAGKMMSNCEDGEEKAPIIFGSTKTLVDIHVGALTLGRVFSGTLKKGVKVKLMNKNSTMEVQNIFLFMGSEKRKFQKIPAGNIAAISGLGQVDPGETIISTNLEEMTPFEEIKYLATPVVTVALEPKMLRDLPKLKRILERYDIEDPNLVITIDEQSGEILLSGLGELHLETVIRDISEEVRCEASAPLVIFVEQIKKKSKIITHELFGTQVELMVEPIQPLSQETKEENAEEESQPISPIQQVGKTIKLKQYNNEIYLTEKVLVKIETETLENILTGLREGLSKGPASSQPVNGVKVTILDFTTEKEKFEHTVPLLRNAVWEALRRAEIKPQEPIYKIQITAPINYLGKVTSILKKRRGKIEDVRSEQDLIVISGTLPVAESFNIDQALRSETEGRAFWQMSFKKYETISPTKINELD